MSKTFSIITDANCDISAELRKEFDIEVVCGTFTYPNGEEETAFLSWDECKYIEDCTCEKFYNALKKDPDGFKTAPPSAGQFYEAFEKSVKEGLGVLAISISSALSGTYGFMMFAKKQIEENYPDAKIYCVDSRRFTAAIGLLSLRAAELRNEGKSLEETAEYIENNKIRYHQAGWLDDLSFVAKKGRMSNAKAFFGTLVGIKPIGELDANGLTSVIGKVKGEKLGYKVLLDYIEALGENLEEQTIVVVHTNRLAQAQTFKQMIEEKFHPRACYLCQTFPMSGINVGPGLMAAYFVGKPITDDLAVEREIISKSLEANK